MTRKGGVGAGEGRGRKGPGKAAKAAVSAPAKSSRANARTRTREPEAGRVADPGLVRMAPARAASGRRQRVDSATAQVEIMQAAIEAGPLVPPAHITLDDCDVPHWQSVIAEFPRSEWTPHALEIAALLAKSLADSFLNVAALRLEGPLMLSDRGTPVVNPRKAIVQMHAAQILSLRRSLSMHARGKGGEARDVGKRREAVKAVEVDNPLSDDLLGGGGFAGRA